MDDASRKELEALFARHGAADFRWLPPGRIEVAHWVRMKCRFGCDEYGRNACCPPNVPDVEACAAFFRDYETAAIFHFAHAVERPEDRHLWTREVNGRLWELERAVFLAGFCKAFVLFMDSCTLCDSCSGRREDCLHPVRARPSPEAMAVDVFTTARAAGYSPRVLVDTRETMDRFALCLVE
jgi:predicted metal-binding protein